MAGITLRIGDTLSWAGTILLPSSTWYAQAMVMDSNGLPVTDCRITTVLTYVGPDGTVTGMYDYMLTLTAQASDTANWPNPGVNGSLSYQLIVKCYTGGSPVQEQSLDPIPLTIQGRLMV